jgi:hypothetical protein
MCKKARIIGPVLFILFAVSAGLSLPAPAAEYVYPGDRQWIYCAEKAEDCFLYCTSHGACPKPDTMYIFIRAADSVGVTRAHFRLAWDYPGCDSILSVTPCPNVAIESGDILQGMTISFPLITGGHFKALTVVFRNTPEQPPTAYSEYGFWIRDARLERPNAQTLALLDYCTGPFYPDCYWRSLLWFHPDTVDAYIGSQTDVKIQWEQHGPGYPGPTVQVTDEKSWMSETTLYLEDTGCLTCPWHIRTEHIYVGVPEGTPAGALSAITFNGLPLESIVLRAVSPIAVEKTSWGAVKSLFK